MGKKKKLLTKAAMIKKYAGTGIANDIVIKPDSSLWLPTKNLSINYKLGGGTPYGKILEAYGEESSGKTLLAYDMAYACQQLGGVVLWNDAEQAFEHDWAITNGLDLNQVELSRSQMVEEISDWLKDMILYHRSKLTNNQPILFVADSVSAFNCKENFEDTNQLDKKAEMGNRAKAIGELLRLRNPLIYKMGVSCIFINQLRKKIGASKFEDPDTTPGGQALRFYASQRLAIYGGKMIKEKLRGVEYRVGRHSTIRTVKNKVSIPRLTIKGIKVITDSDFGEVGFDRYHDFGPLMIRTGVLTKKKGASWYKYKGKNFANGDKGLLNIILNDPKIRKRLIRKSGINTIGKTKKRLEKLTTNLYPVKNYE